MSTQIIKVSNICNIQLFDHRTRRLHVCDSHYDDLCHDISRDINSLVATPFFQREFSQFLSTGNAQIDVTIRIKNQTITVEKLDGSHEHKTIDLSTLADTQDTQNINRDILRVANDVYCDCQSQERHSHRYSHSLRGRASHYEEDHYRRDRSHSPRRRHRHRDVDHSPRRHSDCDSTEARLNLLRETASQLRTDSSSNPHLNQDLSRLEEQIRRLENMLNIAPTTTTEPTSETLLDRLNAIEHAIPTQTPVNPPPEITRTENEPINLTLSDEQFTTLIDLSDALSAQDCAGSTSFPGHLKTTFDTRIPLDIRNGIFYHTYLLCDPTEVPNPWPIGEKLFTGSHETIQAVNLCRAHAIRHFLLLNLATDFGSYHNNPPQHLFDRFEQFSEQDKHVIYTQLQYILQRPTHEDNHEFAAQHFHTAATGRQRNMAMVRVLTDRIAEYQRHISHERLRYIIREFEEAYRRLQEENERLTSIPS